MRSYDPFSPEDFDWFCREVLRELGTFRYLIEVGEKHAVGEVFNLSGQAIGERVRDLEKALSDWLQDGHLHNRLYKKTIPTEAGHLLYAFASDLKMRSEAFLADLHQLQQGDILRLSIFHSAWEAYGSRLEAAIAEAIPGATISASVITGARYGERIQTEVNEWRADVGIVSFPKKIEPPLALMPLPDRQLRLIISPTYSRLPKTKEVSLDSMLRDDPSLKLVLHPRALDGPLSKLILSYLRKIRVDLWPGQKVEAPKIAEIKEMVETIPNSISLIPEDAVETEIIQGRLLALELKPPAPNWTWGAIYRPGGSRRVTDAFLKCLSSLR